MAVAQPLSKIVFFLTAAGGTAPTGWTETFYTQNANLQDVLNAGKVYALQRARLLGKGSQLEYIRVSNVPPNRATLIYYMQGNAGLPKQYINPGDDYDPTQVDLLLRCQTAQGKRRQFWLGGLPDSETDQLLQQGINAAFTNGPSFKALIDLIKVNSYCIRYRTAAGPPPVYTSDTITDVIPIMVRNRKRGRPFDLFRGRRLA